MIRDATHEDIPRLVEMAKRFLSDGVYHRNIAYNPEHLTQLMGALIDGPDALLRVSTKDDEVTGMIGMVAYPHPLSMEPVASELFWWVEPEHRGIAGVKLLKEAEAWADAKNVVRLFMVAPTVEVGHLYARQGYQALEMHYQKDL